MKKTTRWISVLLLACFISGCISYSSTTLIASKGSTSSTTINGKTLKLKDNVLTYEDKTFEVPDGVAVCIKSYDDKVMKIFVGSKLVYEEDIELH